MKRRKSFNTRSPRTASATTARGRPRAFDAEEAINRALKVFWQNGYEGASLPELTKAMGVNRPSLYAAFGNKESLFRKAMARYEQGPAYYIRAALDAPTARAVAERLLAGAIDLLSDPGHPRGCLAVQGALACGDAAQGVRKELADRRSAGQAAVRRRLERARKEGDLPRSADPADLAHYLATITHGMAVQAAGGANRRALKQVARIAMRAWPK